MLLVLVAILCVLCAGVAAVIAQGKGRSVGGFAIAGLLLGVLGVIWAAAAQSGEERERLRRLRHRETPRRGIEGMPPMSWPVGGSGLGDGDGD